MMNWKSFVRCWLGSRNDWFEILKLHQNITERTSNLGFVLFCGEKFVNLQLKSQKDNKIFPYCKNTTIFLFHQPFLPCT